MKERSINGREPWSSGYGGDSYSEDREFKCQHHILDGPFFTFIFRLFLLAIQMTVDTSYMKDWEESTLKWVCCQEQKHLSKLHNS